MPRPTQSEFNIRTQQLIAYLRNEIEKGTLQLGDFLPSEVQLGHSFELSKESVRKALDVLVEEGLISKIRRVGNKVIKPTNLETKNHFSIIQNNPHTMTESDDKIILRLAIYPSLQEIGRLQQAIAEFELTNSSYRVHVMDTPFPLDFVEYGMADVITLTAWDALKLKEKDSSMSLLSDAPETTFAHSLLATPFNSDQNRLKAAPFVFSPLVICYNRKHFAQCQIEEPREGWTWYTLLKIARLLTRQLDVRGFAAHIQSVNRWLIFLLQNGFRFHKGEAQRTAEDPALWDSLHISRDLIYQQGAPVPWTESDADVERWFREEKASMILTTYLGMNLFLDSNLDYGVAPLPSLRSDDTLLLGTGLAINHQSVHQEAARLLVQHLCGLDAQTDIRRNTLSLPAHPVALATDHGLQGNRPHGETIFAELWDRYRLYSDLDISTDVLEAIREELKTYWSRMEDEAEVSERIEALLNP